MSIYFHPSGFFKKSRCTLVNWGNQQFDHTQDLNPSNGKKGIHCYSIITGMILRILGFAQIKHTNDGDFVFVNKKSFKKWKAWRSVPQAPLKPAVAAETVKIKKVKSDTPLLDQFSSVISLTCGDKFSKAVKGLLENIPSKEILNFESEGNDKYKLTFKRTIPLWLDSRDTNGNSDPKGGTIILLGDNKEKCLEFSLNPAASSMDVRSGMDLWCETQIGVRKVKVVKIQSQDGMNIELTAGVKLPMIGLKTQTNRYQIERFTKVWSEATYLKVGEDYKEFLSKKAS